MNLTDWSYLNNQKFCSKWFKIFAFDYIWYFCICKRRFSTTELKLWYLSISNLMFDENELTSTQVFSLVSENLIYFNYFTFSLLSNFFSPFTIKIFVFAGILFTKGWLLLLFGGVWRTSEEPLGGFHFYCQQMIQFFVLTRLFPFWWNFF